MKHRVLRIAAAGLVLGAVSFPAYRAVEHRRELAAAARGRDLFARFCTSCHGPEGRGNGPAAANLQPKPRDLTDMDFIRHTADSVLFDRISHGKHGTAMPAFQSVLSPEDRRDIVAFLRSR